MTVIFHVCYRDLHESIFQIADVTGLMFLLPALMKMSHAGGASCDSPADFVADPGDRLSNSCFEIGSEKATDAMAEFQIAYFSYYNSLQCT